MTFSIRVGLARQLPSSLKHLIRVDLQYLIAKTEIHSIGIPEGFSSDFQHSPLNQRPSLCSPELHRLALETTLGELVPAADHEAHHQVGLCGGIDLG